VGRVLRLTLLAPNIVEAIPNGRQPAGLQLEDLLRRISSAIRPSPKLSCARRISIMFLVPGLWRRIRTQQLMIEFTNSLNCRLQFLIIGKRAANFTNALAPHAELPRPSTGIGYRQNEDVMAFTARAFRTVFGVPDRPLQQ
jgi:hypothetical protein